MDNGLIKILAELMEYLVAREGDGLKERHSPVEPSGLPGGAQESDPLAGLTEDDLGALGGGIGDDEEDELKG